MFDLTNPILLQQPGLALANSHKPDGSNSPIEAQLQSIIREGRLYAAFQPILDFRAKSYFGFEGLIRGPQDTAFSNPMALFEAARRYDLQVELERACRETIFRAFAHLNLPGRLFVNFSPMALNDPEFSNGKTLKLLHELSLQPERIVIEVTENQQIDNFPDICNILEHYRDIGYQIAIDDLGEGFSNLRMWSEIHPEFIKIDRSLISGIDDSHLKYMLVRSINEIAETCGTRIIAEGIETETELTTVRGLGIAFGQGFLIAKPAARPETALTSEMAERLTHHRTITFPGTGIIGSYQETVRSLVQRVPRVTPDNNNIDVCNLFENNPGLNMIPVVHNDRPLGLISRHKLTDGFSRPYRRELFGHKSCTQFMDASTTLIEHDVSIHEAGLIITHAATDYMGEGFIITQQGEYLGVGSTQKLMKLITEMQISSARYANPLTQLPGNVPINQHIDSLLKNQVSFAACYVDIDSFKPFNDIYGYSMGDEMIQLLGRVLGKVCDPQIDFIGHIGGDDFVVLFQSGNWEQRCKAALELFDDVARASFSPEDIDRGGMIAENRSGQVVFHPLSAISIGAIPVKPGQFNSHHEISAAITEAKKQAKRTTGSSLFIDRRGGTDFRNAHAEPLIQG